MCFKEKDHREENETGGIDSKGTRDLRVDRSWFEVRYHSKCDEKLSKGFEQVSNLNALCLKFIFLLPCRD